MSLRALPRPVAVVVGAGGVLGAAHVGVGYAAWLDHMWTRLRRREVYPFGCSRGSVFADRGLRRLIARAGLPAQIERLLHHRIEFGHSERLIDTASLAAARFLDGPGLYRVDGPPAISASPSPASTSARSGAGR